MELFTRESFKVWGLSFKMIDWFIRVNFTRDCFKVRELITRRTNWFIKGISLEVKRMARVFIFLMSSLITRVSLRRICLMARGSSWHRLLFTKESGKRARNMVRVFTIILMGRHIMGIIRRIKGMERDSWLRRLVRLFCWDMKMGR